jgi:predicted permease
VAGELALTFIVVVGATLLAKSFTYLSGTDPGFDPRNTFTVRLSLGMEHRNATVLEDLNRRLVPSIQSLPAVGAAGAVSSLPLELGIDLPFIIEGQYDEGTGQGWGGAQYRAISPELFSAMGIPLLSGRHFKERDVGGAPGVVIINHAASQRFFPEENPIGQRIVIGPPAFENVGAPREIVGVVGDVRELGIERDPPAVLYVPLPQLPPRWSRGLDSLSLVVRTDGASAGLASAVRDKIRAFDPDLPMAQVVAMKKLVARSLGSQEFNVLLMSVFAGLAFLLAGVGVYGVLSYLVGQRVPEIGIRMALGAKSRDVMRMVMSELIPVLGIGLAVGVAGAFAFNRAIESVLFGVSSTDPSSFIVVGVVLAILAAAASYFPARKATKVEPLVALRYE